MVQGSWYALHAQFVRRSQTLAFFQRYRALYATNSALSPFPDSRTVVDFCRDPSRSLTAKNSVLHAVLVCVRDDAETASTLLTLALWPGLDHVYRELRQGFPADADAVAGELIGAFAEVVLKAKPETTKSVAATLILNARRNTIRVLRENKAFAQYLETPTVSPEQHPSNGQDANELLVQEEADTGLADRFEQDFGADGSLIVAVAVHGLSQREVSDRMGIPYGALRKRHQRAVERICRNPPPYLVPRVPLRGSGWHLSNEGAGSAGVSLDDTNVELRRTARTTAGAVPALGTPRDPADRRRVPDRSRD